MVNTVFDSDFIIWTCRFKNQAGVKTFINSVFIWTFRFISQTVVNTFMDNYFIIWTCSFISQALVNTFNDNDFTIIIITCLVKKRRRACISTDLGISRLINSIDDLTRYHRFCPAGIISPGVSLQRLICPVDNDVLPHLIKTAKEQYHTSLP